MIQSNKFEDINERFTSLRTGMTQINKFEDINGQFTSLGTKITQPIKFEDRQWTLKKTIHDPATIAIEPTYFVSVGCSMETRASLRCCNCCQRSARVHKSHDDWVTQDLDEDHLKNYDRNWGWGAQAPLAPLPPLLVTVPYPPCYFSLDSYLSLLKLGPEETKHVMAVGL
jgi:hypothetical protein